VCNGKGLWWKHPEVAEGLLNGRTFFRGARGEAGLLESAHVINWDAAMLFAVGNPSNLDLQSVLLPDPIFNLLVGR